MTPGIHLFHKPPGPTSFSVVQACLAASESAPGRRKRRICHGGTLDPFASGLLLILVEPATRLFDYLHAIPKVYEATVRWGVETDNGDPLGKVTFEGDAAGLTVERLDAALGTFVGWREQVPHATSAKRVEGERAYIKAHRGEVVTMPASRVYLHEARWVEHDLPLRSRLRMMVRGGYYVRAMARDLGRMLGCGAHLSELHRSAIGPWEDPGPERSVALQGRDNLPWAPARVLGDQEVGDLRKELKMLPGELLPPLWPVPEGFPDPEAPIVGMHLEKFAFLLRLVEGKLGVLTALSGGL